MGEAKRRQKLDPSWGKTQRKSSIDDLDRYVRDNFKDTAIEYYQKKGRGAVALSPSSVEHYVPLDLIASKAAQGIQQFAALKELVESYDPTKEFVFLGAIKETNQAFMRIISLS